MGLVGLSGVLGPVGLVGPTGPTGPAGPDGTPDPNLDLLKYATGVEIEGCLLKLLNSIGTELSRTTIQSCPSDEKCVSAVAVELDELYLEYEQRRQEVPGYPDAPAPPSARQDFAIFEHGRAHHAVESDVEHMGLRIPIPEVWRGKDIHSISKIDGFDNSFYPANYYAGESDTIRMTVALGYKPEGTADVIETYEIKVSDEDRPDHVRSDGKLISFSVQNGKNILIHPDFADKVTRIHSCKSI